MEETWQVSHEVGGLPDEADSPLVLWWWGLWLARAFLGTLRVLLSRASAPPLEGIYYVILLVALVNVPLCLVLIRLMNRLTRAQNQANAAGVFG